jgi:hypothetical protein
MPYLEDPRLVRLSPSWSVNVNVFVCMSLFYAKRCGTTSVKIKFMVDWLMDTNDTFSTYSRVVFLSASWFLLLYWTIKCLPRNFMINLFDATVIRCVKLLIKISSQQMKSCFTAQRNICNWVNLCQTQKAKEVTNQTWVFYGCFPSPLPSLPTYRLSVGGGRLGHWDSI